MTTNRLQHLQVHQAFGAQDQHFSNYADRHQAAEECLLVRSNPPQRYN